jgi:hypothetical protein
MGTSAAGQRLARQAKLRLFSHDDGGPAYSLSWHYMAWEDSDGTICDTSGGSYTGEADEVLHRLAQLVDELKVHMHRGVSPFPSVAT